MDEHGFRIHSFHFNIKNSFIQVISLFTGLKSLFWVYLNIFVCTTSK